MGPEVFVDILSDSLFMVILLVSAVIVPSMVVGLAVAVFQAATSINEQTSLSPQIIGHFISSQLGSHWLVAKLMDFTFEIVARIPEVVG